MIFLSILTFCWLISNLRSEHNCYYVPLTFLAIGLLLESRLIFQVKRSYSAAFSAFERVLVVDLANAAVVMV